MLLRALSPGGCLCAGGRSLLFLLPSESAAMLSQLEAARVPLKPLKVNPGRSQPIGPALQALLSKNVELKVLPRLLSTLWFFNSTPVVCCKGHAAWPVMRAHGYLLTAHARRALECCEQALLLWDSVIVLSSSSLFFFTAAQELGQRALVSYMRSVFLQPNKAVFDVHALPAPEFALSLGLSSAPQLRFLRRAKTGGGAAAQGAADGAVQGGGEEGVRALGDAGAGSGSDTGDPADEEGDAEERKAAEELRRSSGAAAGPSGGRMLEEGGSKGVEEAWEAAGGAQTGDEPGAAEEDFLVVKRRDVYDTVPDQAPTAGACMCSSRACSWKTHVGPCGWPSSSGCYGP